MAIKAEKSSSSNPDCIILENNTVIPWGNATQEMKEQYLEENGPFHSPNGDPDRGSGKGQRRKQRRPRHHH